MLPLGGCFKSHPSDSLRLPKFPPKNSSKNSQTRTLGSDNMLKTTKRELEERISCVFFIELTYIYIYIYIQEE